MSFADCDTSQVELWGECYSLSATNISLPNRSLTGPIPPEIGLFENLINLKLKYNNLTGPIPPEIGNLSNLETLELQFNNLSGPIPDGLWGLTNLRQLRLQKNQFTGNISPQIGDLDPNASLSIWESVDRLNSIRNWQPIQHRQTSFKQQSILWACS